MEGRAGEGRAVEGRAVDGNAVLAWTGFRHTATARAVAHANDGRDQHLGPHRHVRTRDDSRPRRDRVAGALPGSRSAEWRQRSSRHLSADLSRRRRARYRLLTRCRCGHRLGSAPSRQQRERIDVPLWLRGQPHAEVQVRRRVLHLPAGPDRADDLALRDRGPHAHGDRAQVHERDREPVGGANRERQPGSRNGSGKTDNTRFWCAHIRARRRSDVDASMLAAGVRVVVEHKPPEHRPVDRPAPRVRRWRCHEGDHHRHHGCKPSVARFENHARG